MPFEILAVLGPTASGKSSLAIEIALQLQSEGQSVEIVNADAMQLYRHLDIGTAKLSESERLGLPHHLIDVFDPSEEVTAVQYQELARAKIQEIIARGNLPILVGGSMFYVSAALDGLDFAPTDSEIRARLEKEQELLGPLAMHEKLALLDPATAQKIPANNLRRVVRALEVIQITGEPYSSTLPEPQFWKPTLEIGISVEREELKRRIQLRAEAMWRKGLLEEVKALQDSEIQLGKTARVAIGYEQAIRQLAGELSEAEAISETVHLTARYARRQMSWFRRDKRIHWVDSAPDLLGQAMNRIRLER
ncbi:MAG: tRNA ((37)-N6)-dimethylallyltransferase MiaA [Actinomycetota bacterium]